MHVKWSIFQPVSVYTKIEQKLQNWSKLSRLCNSHHLSPSWLYGVLPFVTSDL